jgi:type VI protein secretion system component Hcp
MRASIRRSLIGALAVALLGVGYFVNVALDSSGSPHGTSVATKKFSASDLMLIATTADGIHLRYGGITTGGLNSAHTNDIQISGFSTGATRPVTTSAGGGRTIGKPKAGEVVLTHSTDEYSVPLLTASLKGAPTSANLYFTDFSGVEGNPLDYLEINLGGALITRFSTSRGGEGRPSEDFSINFVSMTFKYRDGPGAPLNTVSYNFSTQK